MRRLLSDLLDAVAFTADGLPVGRVLDVRLVQDGPYVEGFGHGLRVEGVLVGPRWRGSRLGFVRAEISGPWPLTSLFRRLERSSRFYAWDQVEAWEPGAVRLRSDARESPVLHGATVE